MGKILKRTYAYRADQVPQFTGGPISILTGQNLWKPSETESNDSKSKEEANTDPINKGNT